MIEKHRDDGASYREPAPCSHYRSHSRKVKVTRQSCENPQREDGASYGELAPCSRSQEVKVKRQSRRMSRACLLIPWLPLPL
ncbi:hypothetical protein NDU88_005230 [Pleurodeles waltl]|uniref:Uncharacterized protein n=1 Tax=Pleurodeles waltl TaxID=8319 RepID=A0AAV7MVS6_PLEWA|nr:hypothetical protein NDU88_005230 [Pleurodeles waltl]